MTDPAMRNMLMVSTCHLTEQTCDRLCETNNLFAMSGPFDETGAFCWVYPEQGEGDSRIPDDLWHVMQFAAKRGADYILFDADAEIDDDLPEYEWDTEPKQQPPIDKDGRPAGWTDAAAVEFIGARLADHGLEDAFERVRFAQMFAERDWHCLHEGFPEFQLWLNTRTARNG